MVAELVGLDRALFLPSATMANEIAIRLLCDAGDELLDPDELLEFHFRHFEPQEKGKTYHIKDISHDGIITLKNKFQTFTFTHEEFCNKPWIMEKTAPLDIYRIVSKTYLNHERNLEKQLSSKRSDSRVVLKIVKPQN